MVVVISIAHGATRHVREETPTSGFDHIMPTLDDAQVTASKPTENVGLHVIGVNPAGSSLLVRTGRDILDWEAFCRTLVEHGNKQKATAAKRIWELIPSDVQKLVALEVRGETGDSQDEIDAKQVRRHILISEALSKVLTRRDFYRADDFKEVRLTPAITKLLDRRDALTQLEVRRLNRLVCEAVFPNEIRKSAGGDDLPETVRVRVVRTARPIILVLTAYKSVRWVVVPEKNVRIKQIIVGGYEPQEITGVDAPIIFKVYESKDGPNKDYILAHSEEEQYSEMKRKLRESTGLEVDSFQYVHEYDGVPFKVRD
jgi:hypothetical protein